MVLFVENKKTVLKHLFVLGNDAESLKKKWPEFVDVVADYSYNKLFYSEHWPGYKITGKIELNLCAWFCDQVVWLSTLHLEIEADKMIITMTPRFVNINEVYVQRPVIVQRPNRWPEYFDWYAARNKKVKDWEEEHSDRELDRSEFRSSFTAIHSDEQGQHEIPAESDGFKTTIQVKRDKCDFWKENFKFIFSWDIRDVYKSFKCNLEYYQDSLNLYPARQVGKQEIFLSCILNYANRDLDAQKNHSVSLDTSTFF